MCGRGKERMEQRSRDTDIRINRRKRIVKKYSKAAAFCLAYKSCRTTADA